MGFAILWIMIYHMPGFASFFPQPLYFIFRIGYLGVDIFLFLSSYGLFYSLNKNKSVKTFYKKRFSKILPTYYFILIFFSLCNNIDIIDFLKNCSFLGFYLPMLKWNSFDWYTPAILLLYLVFPFIFKHLNWIKKYSILLLVFLFTITYFIADYLIEKNLNTSLLLFFTRIPIFIYGAIYAKNENEILASNRFIINITLIIIGFVLLYNIDSLPEETVKKYGLQFYPLLFITPNLLIVINQFNFEKTKYIYNVLSFCGKYSFELYLIHWNLYNMRKYIDSDNNLIIGVYLIICFFVSFPLAKLLNKTINIFTVLKNSFK